MLEHKKQDAPAEREKGREGEAEGGAPSSGTDNGVADEKEAPDGGANQANRKG